MNHKELFMSCSSFANTPRELTPHNLFGNENDEPSKTKITIYLRVRTEDTKNMKLKQNELR